MDSIRWLAIQSIVNRVRTIGPASPDAYNFDFSGAKTYLATKKIGSTVASYADIWPLGEVAEKTKYGKYVNKMTLHIEAAAIFGSDDQAEIGNQLLADLIRSLTDPAWPESLSPRYIDSVRYVGNTDDYADAGQIRTGVTAIFEVTYTTALGDPYSQ